MGSIDIRVEAGAPSVGEIHSYVLDSLVPGVVNGKKGRETSQVKHLANVIYHGTQNDSSTRAPESLGGHNKDSETRTADVIQLGKIDNQPLRS